MRPLILLGFVLGFWSCDSFDRIPPEANFTISPPVGDSLTVFLVDASPSKDNAGESWQLRVRWDMESDGIWETDFSILKSFAFTYHSNGDKSVSCEVMDDAGNRSIAMQTIQVQRLRDDSLFTDTRDGQSYRAVFIYDRWWMGQNLRYGTRIDTPYLPKDNQLAEYFIHPKDKDYGGFYTWDEATWYQHDTAQGICPQGWRLPKTNDIKQLTHLTFFNQYLDKLLAPGGSLGLDLVLSGRYIRTYGIWDGAGYRGNFWISDNSHHNKLRTWAFYRSDYQIRIFYEGDWGIPGQEGWPRDWGDFSYAKVALPVRCVKERP